MNLTVKLHTDRQQSFKAEHKHISVRLRIPMEAQDSC